MEIFQNTYNGYDRLRGPMTGVPEQRTAEGDEMIPKTILGDIDQLLQLTDPAERAQLAKSIRERIEARPRFTENAEAQYLWGFVAFIDPDRKNAPDLQRSCRNALQRALSIDPGHGRAWLYIGHILLEAQDFPEARIAFAQAEQHLERVSMYLKVKAAEMRLVSTVKSPRRKRQPALVPASHSAKLS